MPSFNSTQIGLIKTAVMKIELKQTIKLQTKLQTRLRKYGTVAGVIVTLVFISVFLINYLGSPKDAFASGGSKTAIIAQQNDIIISEYASKGHLGVEDNEFIELYNLSESTLDLSYVSLKLYNKNKNGSSSQKGVTLQLTGTLLPDCFYVIAVRNKSNSQPTSALDYDIQAPSGSGGWELKNKRYITLLSGTSVIDKAGSINTQGDEFNYERVDYLADGSDISNHWLLQVDSVSSPGYENISNDPLILPVTTSSYTDFGSNGNSNAAVKIKSNGSTHPGNTKIKVKRGKVHPNAPSGTTMIKRYIEITPDNQPDNVEMVFYYNDSELNGLNELTLKLYSYYDNTWHLQGGVVDAVNNTITCSAINHFSDWGAGGEGGGLPIDLLTFVAKYNGTSVDLSWTTAAEINNDYFTIEKSMDAKNYKIVDNIKGAGNSNTNLNYKYNDKHSLTGTVFYRLKQTDYDGKNETFPAVAVKIASVQNKLPIGINSVNPNPFTNTFYVTFDSQSKDAIEIYLYNIRGQIAYKEIYQPKEGNNRFTFTDKKDLSPGYYILSLKQNNEMSKGVKIVKSKSI